MARSSSADAPQGRSSKPSTAGGETEPGKPTREGTAPGSKTTTRAAAGSRATAAQPAAKKPAAKKPAGGKPATPAAEKPARTTTRRSRSAATADPNDAPATAAGSPADAGSAGTDSEGAAASEQTRSLGDTVGDVVEQARSRLADLGIDTDSLDPRNVSDIVGRAASVLEEELASGILAAQRVEQRFVDVDRVRDRDPDELISRLRRDVHDLVDILIDLLDVAASSTLGMSRKVVSIRSTSRPPSPPSPRRPVGVSVLEMPGTVAPGSSATVSMLVDNESDDETEPFELVSSDLVSVENGVIAGNRVRLDPAEVRLAPHERRRIGIEVDVPKGTRPGTYVGMVQASRMEHVRALLTVRVE